MSDVVETKPDPTTTAPEEQKPETTATGEGEKTVTEAAADTAKDVAETAKDAAVKTSDSVFSMFGGGPKKEKKEDEAEEGADEPSGSSKAQKAEEVSLTFVRDAFTASGDLEHRFLVAINQRKTKGRGAPAWPRVLCGGGQITISMISGP